MNTLKVKTSIYLTYFVFSILINSVVIVIAQSISIYGVDNGTAHILEVMKDISFAGVAFLFSPFIPRIGYKRSMLIALASVAVLCVAMPFAETEERFWAPKILFTIAGTGFAFVSVSAYSLIGMIAKDHKQHAGMINFLESFFVLGFVGTLAIFGLFAQSNLDYMSYSFWVISLIAIIACGILFFTKVEEPVITSSFSRRTLFSSFLKLGEMVSMLTYTLVFMFILSLLFLAFTQVQFEKWLPTFSDKILHIDETAIKLELLGLVLFAIFLGRVFAGFLIRKMGTLYLLVLSMLGVMVMLTLVTREAQAIDYVKQKDWTHIPNILYFVLLMAFFWGPILPTLYATVLSNIERSRHSMMAGLILVVFMICSRLGRYVSGYIFDMFSISVAFFFSIVFITLALVLVYLFITDLKSSK